MRFLSRLLRPFRTPSFEEVERVEREHYRRHVAPGMTVFDVGANRGELTLLFASLAGDGIVHAFEPAAATFETLERAVAGCRNVVARRLALSDAEGDATLHCYGGPFHVFSSLAARPLADYGVDAGPVMREIVQISTLDAYCEAEGIARIDLLKIDVEGAELQVLRGARGLLREQAIGRIVFEFGQATFDMGNRPSELIALFQDHGYVLSNVVEGARLFPGGSDVRTARYAMHVAVPR